MGGTISGEGTYGVTPWEYITTSESECQNLCHNSLTACLGIDIMGSPLCSESLTTCESTPLSLAPSAPAAPTPEQFVATPPKLEIPIPTLPSLSNFASVTPQGEAPNRFLLIPWISQYIAAIYKYAIGIVGILAGLMIVFAGLIWLTAGGSAERVGTAKKMIGDALVGLVIALTSYLILYAINPSLTSFDSLKIKFIEHVDLNSGWAAATPAQETAAISNPPVASGDTPRDQLLSVCKTKNSGLSKENLLAVLPTWVEIGDRGGASYIRGGLTSKTECTSNPQPSYAKDALEKQGIAFDPNASTDTLRQIYQKEIVDKVYAAGRLCGDCIYWTQQLLECAGMDFHIRLPQLASTRDVPQRVATSNTSCADAASKVPGGLKFGDIFHYQRGTTSHMVSYWGGTGLPYEIVEMGGGINPNCEDIPGLKEKLACVQAHTKKEDWSNWSRTVDYCDIFRILP
jgi:hypothetical protein